MASIQKRGNSYRIRCSTGYDSKGRQIMRSTTWTPDPGMTPRQVEKELQRQAVLFEEKCKASGTAACTIKFEPFAHEWFTEYAEKQLRIRTVARLHQLEPRTYQAIGHLRMDKITARQIQSFINNLAEPGINKRTGGGLSPKTQSHYLSFISSVFDYAIRMDMLTDNPTKRVTIQKLEQKEREVYTLEETQHFLDLMQTEPPVFQAFFVLAIYGGFRRAEILGLEWKDIDFETGVVTISRSSLYAKGVGTFTDTTKTKGSQRSLKLPLSVIDILRVHRKAQLEQRLQMGDQWHDHDRLFTTWNGEPMGTGTPRKWLIAFCEKHGLRYLGIHSFRHLNASLLINSGVDLKTVSASLGHSQTSTTLNIYAHTFAAAQARASEAIAEVLPLHTKKA